MATIVQSASTNVPGYRIFVHRNDLVDMERQGTTTALSIAPHLVTSLLHDLATAGPLDRLPTASCMKSASFGTTLRVSYRGRQSPDLECAQGAVVLGLSADVNRIVDALPVPPPSRMRGLLPVKRVMPRNPDASDLPTPSAAPSPLVPNR